MAENLVNSLVKALKALDILVFEDADKNGVPLSVLSKKTGVPPNTLHNLLKTLVKCGYAAQKDDSSSYVAGPKCDSVGRKNQWAALLHSALSPIVQKCAADIDENIILCALLDGRRIPLLSFSSSQAVGVDSSKMSDQNFYSLVSGRVLASFASSAELGRILENWGLPGDNWDGLSDEASLRSALAAVKKGGLARDILRSGVLAVALPVFYPDGALFGALGCHLPHFRCDAEREKSILSRMRECCSALSKALGDKPR